MSRFALNWIISPLAAAGAAVLLAPATITAEEVIHELTDDEGNVIFTDKHVEADKYYQSETEDGTVIFSDAPAKNGEVQRTSYSNSYGKPMATASCVGATTKVLGERYADMHNPVLAAAKLYDVDPLLIKAIARVESCYDPKALSVAGAQGLMQLMPATAAELGVSDSFNIEQNIGGGTKYIAKMLKMFDNTLDLALAAYNAGPGNVIRYAGIPPFPETENYVEQVNKHYQLFLAAKQP